MKTRVLVNGNPVEVELERNGSEWKAGGRALSAIEVEPGIYSVLLDGRSFEARVERTFEGTAVTVGPRRYTVEVVDPRRLVRNAGRGAREGRQRVLAPMPGKVVRLLVAAGEAVEAGQGIAVVEAMKMQNEMKAPKSGRVSTLHVQEGQPVSGGEVIAEIE